MAMYLFLVLELLELLELLVLLELGVVLPELSVALRDLALHRSGSR